MAAINVWVGAVSTTYNDDMSSWQTSVTYQSSQHVGSTVTLPVLADAADLDEAMITAVIADHEGVATTDVTYVATPPVA